MKSKNLKFFYIVLFSLILLLFILPIVQAKDYTRVDIANLRSLEKDTRVITRGVVAVELGVLAKTYFYIVDEKEKIGIQIYMYKQDFPELAPGDLIQVKGIISEVYGETRIKIGQKEDFKILAHGELPQAWKARVEELGENLEGALVQIEGDLLEKKGDYFYIDDGTGEIKVYVKPSTGIDKSFFSERDLVRVSGIVSQTKLGYRVLTRRTEDVELIRISPAGSLGEDTVQIPENSKAPQFKYLCVLGIVLAIILINLIRKK